MVDLSLWLDFYSARNHSPARACVCSQVWIILLSILLWWVSTSQKYTIHYVNFDLQNLSFMLSPLKCFSRFKLEFDSVQK